MRAVADLVVKNAALWSGSRLTEADTIAIAEGRVLTVGRAPDLAPLVGPATVTLDARGATVTPGLVDAHIHLVAWARADDEIDLGRTESRSEVLARVAAFLTDHPGKNAAIGRGWSAERWSEAPERSALDAISGDRPVLLHSRDFHNLWVNSAALRRAGIDRSCADPVGGRIERDGAGEPTGLLREHAVRLCAALEAEAGGTLRPRLDRAVRKLHAFGITAVHDFEGAEALPSLLEMTRGTGPRLRVLMHLPHRGLEHALALGLQSGIGDGWFRLGGVKLFADGTLGSRTAALLAPYDGTDELGFELLGRTELGAIVRTALERGLAIAIHAIGDRAVRSALDAFEGAREFIPRAALPPRIEHVQLLDSADLPRFAALGVAASMQPVHCTSDLELAQRYWGARLDRAYPWRSLLESGSALAFGSDAPVEAPCPAWGLHAAVTRERRGEARPFVPEQRIDLDHALSAYTAAPARLAGLWPSQGNLAAGSAADLVIWNADLHRLPPAQLAHAHSKTTILAGEVVYRERSAEASGAETPADLESVKVSGGGAR